MEFPYEKEAFNGSTIPEDATLVDAKAFLLVGNLLQSFKNGVISKETASIDKQKIYRQWEKEKKDELFYRKCGDWSVRMYKESERLKAECRKNPSKENVEKLLKVLDGLVIE